MELLSVSPPSSFALLNLLSQPVFGSPVLVWQLVLVAFLLFRIFGGSIFGSSPKVAASHILVKEEALCQMMKAELEAASAEGNEAMVALFRELAATHSICPSGKTAGGGLGQFTRGSMVPEFDAVCWTAPIGIVQGPVQTGFGHHLILVTEREEGAAERSDATDGESKDK